MGGPPGSTHCPARNSPFPSCNSAQKSGRRVSCAADCAAQRLSHGTRRLMTRRNATGVMIPPRGHRPPPHQYLGPPVAQVSMWRPLGKSILQTRERVIDVDEGKQKGGRSDHFLGCRQAAALGRELAPPPLATSGPRHCGHTRRIWGSVSSPRAPSSAPAAPSRLDRRKGTASA